MSNEIQVRDLFYSTYAVVAVAVVAFCAFASTDGKRAASPMPSVQAFAASTMSGAPNPAPMLAVDQAGPESDGASIAAADRMLVGASIATYDR